MCTTSVFVTVAAPEGLFFLSLLSQSARSVIAGKHRGDCEGEESVESVESV